MAFLQEQDFPETSFYLSKANYLEITHRSVSKGHALALLKEMHGLSMEETFGFWGPFQ
ncbi:HAD family hydrolase [Streptococcus sp.]|uniref:HAD family hydrolase n=1 Tax=Streptococcus sp. TaxID=1306 RepID=UPI00391997C0